MDSAQEKFKDSIDAWPYFFLLKALLRMMLENKYPSIWSHGGWQNPPGSLQLKVCYHIW